MRRPWVWLLALLAFSLACVLDLGGPTPPAPPVMPEKNARQGIEDTWKRALAEAAAGDRRFVLRLSESQLTGLLAEEFKGQGAFRFTHPVVVLRRGRIEIYGEVQREKLRARVFLVLTPNTSAAGECPDACALYLREAQFGPWKMPNAFRDALVTLIQDAILGKDMTHFTRFQIQRVTFHKDGTVLIEGQLK